MTNDEIDGVTDEAIGREGVPLLFARVGSDSTLDGTYDMIDSGLSGTVIDGVGFIVPFRDWTSAEECLRIVVSDVKQARDGS